MIIIIIIYNAFCLSQTWLLLYMAFQASLSLANCTVSSKLYAVNFMFSAASSLLTRLTQVVLGLPLGLFTGLTASFRACLAEQSSGSLSRCPVHFNLRFFISLLYLLVLVLSYSTSFDIFSGQNMFITLLNGDL